MAPAREGEEGGLGGGEKGIIGAGFGRTGTASMLVALDEIGYGPSMHMFRLFNSQPHDTLLGRVKRMLAFRNAGWEKTDKKKRYEYLREAMHGYVSTVDFPACLFYEDFMEMYPHKKVVLTVRNSTEEWHHSASSTIFKQINPSLQKDVGLWLFMNVSPPGLLVSYFYSVFDNALPGFRTRDLRITYDDWVAKVKRTVPQDRLLVFNVKEGWGPLAKFLDVPIPTTPFPRLNDAREIDEVLSGMRVVGYISVVLYLVVGYLLARCVMRSAFGGRTKKTAYKKRTKRE